MYPNTTNMPNTDYTDYTDYGVVFIIWTDSVNTCPTKHPVGPEINEADIGGLVQERRNSS